MSVVCPSCGEENPGRARFCLACGASLGTPKLGEERKTVSVLFVDLVAFTARSDAADPEDVRATLQPYHERVRAELGRFGGTVEKFVGDAVMAVFGAPISHEDDAERAVRAGLRVIEATGELGLEVRVAVATGQAVVQLGARPEAGEGIATGDVVNTAARLQGAAPTGGLVVSELTYRATRTSIDYEELVPVELKGKADPVPLWLARSARSRFGIDVEIGGATLFVGREHELGLLHETYGRVCRDATVQLVTLIGEPGVGKTRLLSELARWLDDQPDLVYWRQGRCLPYGDGITFWALGEIVKAQAGILESDTTEQVSSKLAAAVAVVAEADREWVAARLAPLVGVPELTAVTREESFTAWRTFLEGVAAVRPLVLLVEDIHWADAALLEFLDHLLDWSNGVPLLVLCTARPELYDRHQGWGGGKRNSTTVALAPLSSEDTARLIATLLERPVLPAETQEILLERAGGNPLYAEEFARMLVDRGGFDEHTPVPETVQALIAARIDTLAPAAKAVLHNAAVVGKVFWAESVAALQSGEADELLETLNHLVRKELIRPARASSMEGAREYAFWHLLVRDVAYGQIPRRDRALKHVEVARWLERIVGERVADHAELLAHHYGEALALARAAGAGETAELVDAARRFYRLAGDRAAGLDAPRSATYYASALDLWPADDPERIHVVLDLTRSLSKAGEFEQAIQLGEHELGTLHADADPYAVGALESVVGHTCFNAGDVDRAEALIATSVALLERQPPSAELVEAYGRAASRHMFREQWGMAVELSRKAIALAEDLGVGEAETNIARQMLGTSRIGSGDIGGFADLEDAVARGSAAGLSSTSVAWVNIGSSRVWATGPSAALEAYEQALGFAKQRGLWGNYRWAQAESLWALYDLGAWDDVLRIAEEVLADSAGREQVLAIAEPTRARVLLARGDVAAAAAVSDSNLPRARAIDISQVVGPALPVAASIALARGDVAGTRALLQELANVGAETAVLRLWYLPESLRAAVAIGELGLAHELAAGLEPTLARERNGLASAQAILAEAAGEVGRALELYRRAAKQWECYGSVVERGHALAGMGRCGDAAAGSEARELFTSLGARWVAAPFSGAAAG
ncbi:MAG TPA: AAA family ATPase [Gaiellaceae bacterium]|nr:AAA family ATPase [Gaiellaceae bacterium]